MFHKVNYVRLPKVCGCFPSLGNSCLTLSEKSEEKNVYFIQCSKNEY